MTVKELVELFQKHGAKYLQISLVGNDPSNPEAVRFMLQPGGDGLRVTRFRHVDTEEQLDAALDAVLMPSEAIVPAEASAELDAFLSGQSRVS
jgi:hypothetical protein